MNSLSEDLDFKNGFNFVQATQTRARKMYCDLFSAWLRRIYIYYKKIII